MTTPDATLWQPIATAPRDGTLVLVRIRATEQGPDEHDMVRWATSARSGEENWVATDSDPFARVAYADNELAAWMPLPTQLPKLRSATRPPSADASTASDETDGSAI